MWTFQTVEVYLNTLAIKRIENSPSNRPEKLSVALHLFFFLFLFLASGMSMGRLDGMSACHNRKKVSIKNLIRCG